MEAVGAGRNKACKEKFHVVVKEISRPMFILMDCMVFTTGGQWLQNVGEVNHCEAMV